jgi:FdhD protein
MLEDFDTHGRILLATGRVSSEMLVRGALMGCPIIASRNSATSMSVAMARAWNITLIGYVRQNTMRVYSHPQRLGASISFEGDPDEGNGN